jgi:imidazolonepropionase-like amidohydrolase
MMETLCELKYIKVCLVLLSLTLLSAFGIVMTLSGAVQSEAIVVKAEKIYTVTNGTLMGGEILVQDGKIREVGKSVSRPSGFKEYEAQVVIPGMIDAHSHIALDRSGRSSIPGPVTAEWKAVENLNLDDPMIQVALSGGVTSVITRSGSGIISSGQSVALKMKSTPSEEMIFKPYVDLKMAVRPLINLRPGETPQTVMGWYATADEYFRRAEAYIKVQEDYESGVLSGAPLIDERLEAFAAVIRGEVMVHVHSHYPSEIMMVMRLARKYGFIDRLALGHAEEVFPIIELVKETKIVPVIGPMMIVQYFGEDRPRNLLKDLLDAGIPASIQTDMSAQHFKDFREYGAFLARHGLTDLQALEVMTINGAKAMMLDDRVGSIEEGKDADLVLLDGHFLDLTADRVERVFVDGVLEYERPEELQPDRPRTVGPFGSITGNITSEDDVFAITNAHLFTVSDGEIGNATILVEKGKFKKVGTIKNLPDGIPVMDVGGRVILPGWILARAFPNDWIGDLKWQVQNDEITEPAVPEMNAIYAVDPWFPSYKINLEIGVTSINVTPGTQNFIGGSGVVIKPVGLDFEKMAVKEPSSLVFSLTSQTSRFWNQTSDIPATLAAASELIRNSLKDSWDYAENKKLGDYNQRLEAMMPVIQRKVPAIFQANTVNEIREAMEIAGDFNLNLVVAGGVEAHKIAEELATAGVAVILGNSGAASSEIRGGGAGWSIEGPAILSRAGVKVAFFGPGGSRRASPIGRLGGEPALNAAWAFRNGTTEVEALRMGTLNAAEILGLGDQLGSIDPGKQADFMILEGHPFEYDVIPLMVFVDGRLEVDIRGGKLP